jgi:hypothetical protein
MNNQDRIKILRDKIMENQTVVFVNGQFEFDFASMPWRAESNQFEEKLQQDTARELLKAALLAKHYGVNVNFWRTYDSEKGLGEGPMKPMDPDEII